MSFLGTIGHIMGGSGLQELLECVYAPNAVVHMLSGKAVSRAVRGHFLVESTLYALILSEIYGIQIPNEENGGGKNPNDESRELQSDDTDLDMENHSAENSSDCNLAQKAEMIASTCGILTYKLFVQCMTICAMKIYQRMKLVKMTFLRA